MMRNVGVFSGLSSQLGEEKKIYDDYRPNA